MKKLLKISALFGASLLMFTGCENPDTSEELPYYIAESIAYLDNVDEHIVIYHSPNGIVNGDVTMPMTVCVTKAMTSDCKVVLECTVESESEGLTADKISIPETITIPAGEKSVTVQVSVSDWSGCTAVADAASYAVSLKIAEAPIRISTNMNSTIYTLDKTAMQYTSTLAPTEGSQVSPEAYTMKYSTNEGNPNWRDIKLSATGTFSTIFSMNYLALQFDLGSTQIVTAVANDCNWGASYNDVTYTIMTSNDGQEWTTYDENADIGDTMPQYISFYTPVEARYVQLHMHGMYSCSSGAYIYVK